MYGCFVMELSLVCIKGLCQVLLVHLNARNVSWFCTLVHILSVSFDQL